MKSPPKRPDPNKKLSVPSAGHPIEPVTNKLQIVGIGASAGGLEALEQFFQNMPVNSGMAFVVIQHLDPTHTGIMPELLQRITTMKVLQSSDGLKVKPNYVYVIPPNKSLSIHNGLLQLLEPAESRGLRLPIDVFFRSLAADLQQRSIGVILSGMGSDGSLGVKLIRESNGIVLVQDPGTAKFDAMPRNAIDAVRPDIIASADQLPIKLMAFLKLNPIATQHTEIESKIKSNLDKIILLIRDQTGHDFSSYKKNTLFRRIERRKNIHGIEKIQHYVSYLQENPEEINILFKELLIGVTNFFRDRAVWENLGNEILPEYLNNLPDGYSFRAWIPGCSTGEEAYSLAILLRESLGKLKKRKKIIFQIFASDIDIDAIEKARKGLFPKNIIADVPTEKINNYFTVDGDYFRINSSIREMVIFAPQNVIKDPPFTKLDLVTCRNLLIYMEQDLQKKIITLFNYSLNPGGIMVLGTAETLGNQNNGFTELDAKLKIYKKSTLYPTSDLFEFPSSFKPKKKMTAEKIIPTKNIENLQTLADQMIIQRYAPASVLVNNKGDILYITGRTGKYLEPVAGKANWNIHAMAREELNHELPEAFRKAIQSNEPVIIKNIRIGSNGDKKYVDVTVQCIETPNLLRGMILVVFQDVSDILTAQLNVKYGKQRTNSRYRDLELELHRRNEEIQSIREEMQTSQEELKSTNEELQSTNEELQSSNEELTTSKEEMQSLNEELQTVNLELQSKLADFVKASDDMKNLLNSTEIAALFLDKELNIRRFTDQVANIFKIRQIDIGRPFTDLVTILLYPDIAFQARQVIKTLITTEKIISTNDDKWYNLRIMPYRTIDDRIDGLVMTFSDITISKRLELELLAANEQLIKKDNSENKSKSDE